MNQYIVIVILIAFIYFFFIKKKPLKRSSKEKKDTQPNDMVQCEKCGVYCEIDDAIISHAKYYCSSECLREVR